MNKKLIRLTESDLHRIVKESVRKTLYESVDPYLEELAKEMNYYHSEAMQNLQGLLKTYNKLPEEYSSMKNSNVATIRNAIKSLELVFKGKEWRDVPMM
jgi:hypothetical protein